MRRLPSLNALRTFEAAARHMNFTRAADELCVTQTAVSHQIKSLEAYLEVRLFRRSNNALSLTDKGEAYFQSLHRVFDLIAHATDTLVSAEGKVTLTVGAMPSFAMRWMIPHLPSFHRQYPDISIDVRLLHSVDASDFARDRLDAVIRPGTGWQDYDCSSLLPIVIFPVCSPVLLRSSHALEHPKDLVKHTILRVSTAMVDEWRVWLRAEGAASVNIGRGPRFDSYSYAWQAAIEGVGVAIGRRYMLAAELASGKLVKPFPREVETGRSWYLVASKGGPRQREMSLFRDWISAEARGECEAGALVA
ncbi:MAG: transcriptional regulator GcvA [Verrucomicrobia bacterium]|nr:transcriptional regulator GcvA [Verrucomicrobiota bacterium]